MMHLLERRQSGAMKMMKFHFGRMLNFMDEFSRDIKEVKEISMVAVEGLKVIADALTEAGLPAHGVKKAVDTLVADKRKNEEREQSRTDDGVESQEKRLLETSPGTEVSPYFRKP